MPATLVLARTTRIRSRPVSTSDLLKGRTPAPLYLLRWGDVDLVRAWSYAERAHRGQVRKYTGAPYITHPLAVCRLVRLFGGTVEMQCASILHDVLDDTNCTLRDVHNRFGTKVAMMVREVSTASDEVRGTRAVRKAHAVRRLMDASPEAKSIKLADAAHNMASIVSRAPGFATMYLPEKHAEIHALKGASLHRMEMFAKRVHKNAVLCLSSRHLVEV